ncbi:MAG TPA: TolC family protein, partial [Thermoanaerobaculia bacterium]|nr:TolC family protein [Thermoanaerobaculia bacterium]
LDLARRERLPDVALSGGYARQGPDVAPVTPPTLSLGAAFELPVFSQRQGEIARAESERESAAIALSRTEARATADVDAAWAALAAARERVTRMETVLLDRARETRDLVRYQYREGAVSLLDLFDAERTALQVELENAQSLYALRVAVVDLEAAVERTPQP